MWTFWRGEKVRLGGIRADVRDVLLLLLLLLKGCTAMKKRREEWKHKGVEMVGGW